MPINPNAAIEITAFQWVPPGAQGLVKDLRVRWALEEAGLDYRVRLIGGERPPGYEQDQPFNQVPCLRDDKVQIFESGAILQYIGEQSEALLPRDTQARFRAIQWTYAGVSSVEPFVQLRALLNVVFADQDWAEPAKPTFEHFARLRLQQLSDRLGDKQWMEGDRFTIGDLMLVTVLRIADRSGQLADFPHLSSYVKRGEARPAFQQALSDQLAAFREHEPEGAAA
ncbi:MAG TPA: glutathione S-transferase family protein [Sphingomicrobium sp.]|nr:glutathione S-transferase family protein [Sphingomicrobium sp.]